MDVCEHCCSSEERLHVEGRRGLSRVGGQEIKQVNGVILFQKFGLPTRIHEERSHDDNATNSFTTQTVVDFLHRLWNNVVWSNEFENDLKNDLENEAGERNEPMDRESSC